MVPHKAADVVFPRPDQHADYRSWFLPALKEAEITEHTWHGNRHTFCLWLAMAGVSIKAIQVLAGRKTISMSARYSRLSPEV
jgi:site-specific recombinase XerD